MAVLTVDHSKTNVGPESAKKTPPAAQLEVSPDTMGRSAEFSSLKVETDVVLFHGTTG